MTRQAITTAALLLTCLMISGCSMPQRTSTRTLGAIEANPGGYDRQLVAFWGRAVDVNVNGYGMQVLVGAGAHDEHLFRAEFPGPPPFPNIVRGDSVSLLGYVNHTTGVVGFGDRLTRTVQIDAVALYGPHDGYSLSSSRDLVDRWKAGEPVVLP
jgi:hypothetical protein